MSRLVRLMRHWMAWHGVSIDGALFPSSLLCVVCVVRVERVLAKRCAPNGPTALGAHTQPLRFLLIPSIDPCQQPGRGTALVPPSSQPQLCNLSHSN